MSTPSSENPPALEFRAVGFSTPGKPTIFSQLDWRVAPGSTIFLAGDSGSGKSTLLRMVNRLVEPSSGAVACDGRAVHEWDIRALRKHAVYVPQRAALLADNMRDDLRTALDWQGLPHNESLLRQALATAQLQQMDLSRATQGLSEGERGRLGVARALLLQPAIVMLDEPTAALDPRTAAGLLRSLKGWADEANRTLIVITHRLDEPVQLQADTVFLLDQRLFGPFSWQALEARDLPGPVKRFCDTTRGES